MKSVNRRPAAALDGTQVACLNMASDRRLSRMVDVAWAKAIAERHLAAALPGRWAHVQAVAARASEIVDAAPDDGELVVAAAWLHDVGYASHC